MNALGRIFKRTYLRGVAPWEGRTIQQTLEARKPKPYRVNIGLPSKMTRSDRIEALMEDMKKRRNSVDLEKLARNQKLTVDLDEANKDWLLSKGPEHIKKIADHYGVFMHLYDEGYFYPVVPLDIFYQINEEEAYPVYYGNVVKPTEANKAPDVSFEAEDGTYWTLMLTNLDGNLEDSDKEYLHWCITNIPGNKVEKGETIVEYLQPLPPRGTGFHRYVFLLYKQNGKVDFDFQKVNTKSPLSHRTFHTRDWYSKYQDKVTPAGLAFFQSDWDKNLKDVFHSMDMKEPVYEYDFPAPYLKPQTWFPKRQPFNVYMDRYRDEKQIAKEYLLKKLKKENPFKKPDPPLKFPNAYSIDHRKVPSWLRVKEKNDRLGFGRINDYK